MSRNILMTVGTSLLTNKLQGDIKGLSEKAEKILDTRTMDAKKALREHKVLELVEKLILEKTILGDFKAKYLKLDLEKEISKRFSNKTDPIAAELSSLYLFYNKYEDGNFLSDQNNIPLKGCKDKVYLICSETLKSIFCAYVIKEFLASNDKFISFIDKDNIKIKVIENLRLDDLGDLEYDFERKGIDNFINVCLEILKEGDIVNISGGYKALGPYLTILSMCIPKTRIFYLYERAKEILELPHLAINMDILLWRDYRGITAILPYIKNLSQNTFESFLPQDSIKGLFDNKFKLNKFGEILKDRYKEQKTTRITEFGTGFILSDRLKRIDDKLGKVMESLIHHWQHLWLGDTLRETVEHSRGHVQRLQEIAAQILFQIFEHKSGFLSAGNFFKLICAIWLHDIGHSSECFTIKLPHEKRERIYSFPGFPTITRDLHHFISASLIKKEKKDIFNYDNIPVNQSKDIDNSLEDIIDICRYHRKKMPSLRTSNSYEEYGLRWDKPIEDFNEDMQFLISLFSLIDESDVQQERAYPENYRLWRKKQNSREESILEKQFKSYFNALTDIKQLKKINTLLNPDNKIDTKSEDLLDKFSEFVFNDEYLKEVDKAVEKHIMNLFIKEGFFDENKILTTNEIIYRDILSIVSRFLFKKRQPAHFEKHKGVLSVGYVLTSDEIDDKRDDFRFDVYLTFCDDNKYCQNAAKDIYTQYHLRKEFLNKKGFYLNHDCFRFVNINDSQQPSIWEIQDNFDKTGDYKPEIVQKS